MPDRGRSGFSSCRWLQGLNLLSGEIPSRTDGRSASRQLSCARLHTDDSNMSLSSAAPKGAPSFSRLFSCCRGPSQAPGDVERAVVDESGAANVEAQKKRQAAEHIAEILPGAPSLARHVRHQQTAFCRVQAGGNQWHHVCGYSLAVHGNPEPSAPCVPDFGGTLRMHGARYEACSSLPLSNRPLLFSRWTDGLWRPI